MKSPTLKHLDEVLAAARDTTRRLKEQTEDLEAVVNEEITETLTRRKKPKLQPPEKEPV